MRIVRLEAGEEAPIGAPAIHVFGNGESQYLVRVITDDISSFILGPFNHAGMAEWRGIEALAEEGAWQTYIKAFAPDEFAIPELIQHSDA